MSNSYIDASAVQNFFALLNKSEIEYVLLHNIQNELPYKLGVEKDIDILVQKEDLDNYLQFMQSLGFREIPHPQSAKFGWVFAYGANECHKHENSFMLMVDVHCELCVKSTMGNIWVPLDAELNRKIWQNKFWDNVNKWYILDNKTMLVHLIARSVFDKQKFSIGYIDEIEKLKYLVNDADVYSELSKIFYKYTDTLVKKIIDGNYDDIYKSYLSFSDY